MQVVAVFYCLTLQHRNRTAGLLKTSQLELRYWGGPIDHTAAQYNSINIIGKLCSCSFAIYTHTFRQCSLCQLPVVRFDLCCRACHRRSSSWWFVINIVGFQWCRHLVEIISLLDQFVVVQPAVTARAMTVLSQLGERERERERDGCGQWTFLSGCFIMIVREEITYEKWQEYTRAGGRWRSIFYQNYSFC